MIKTKATPLHIAATLLMLMACFIPAKAVMLNSTNFPDANFRAALTQITGVAENGTFDATAITTLDVTGKGITNLTGIANFTELTELILDDNDLDFLNLTSNSKLKKLSMRNNDRMIGFSVTTAKAGQHYINMANGTPLEEFDASESAAFSWFSSVESVFHITSIKKLVLKNCPKMDGWAAGFAKQTGLEYLDLTNTKQTTSGLSAAAALPSLTALKTLILSNNNLTDGISFAGKSNLETLILSDNSSLTYANVSNMPNLKYLDMSGTDLWFEARQKIYLKPANNPLLETFIAESCNWSSVGSIDGFLNLKTVKIGGNKFAYQEINNCPALESVDISNNANVTYLALTNSGFTAVPSVTGSDCAKLKTLVLDGNQFTDVPEVGGPFTCLSLQSNNLPAVYTLTGNTLEGLDLGKNGLTSVTVENSAMSALALGGNTSLTEVHLHGNANLKKTASADGISAAQGLYIKGLSALKVLDIENSSFEELGQSNSTDGCTGIETLKAANNKFTTFSNAYTSFADGSRTAVATRSSLEKLTGLKYLDLSNNLLQDSLHLHKNTLLETLIVRNNRTIDRYDNRTDYLANTKVRNGLSVNSGKGKAFLEPNDIGAYNDTTGLRMLNLIYNKELKYLDISYTAIHHFARDGRFDGYKEDYYVANFATKATETVKNREPHYLIVTNCNKLVEFYADYNGMKSAAFVKNAEGHNFPDLKRISMIETRGQDSYTMQGSWNPNGKDGCPNVEYINVANSDLDSVGVTKLPHLKYLNVSGNWTKNNWSHWSSTGVGHTLNLKANGELVECVADDCPHLVIAQANDKTNLTSLSLNNNPELKQVYVPNTGLARINGDAYGHPDPNPDTRTQQAVGGLGLAGLNTATNLELLYCEDNSNLTSLDVTANSNLKYLHAYNNAYGADGLDLSGKQNLKSAWVSNSGLTSLQLNGAVALDTLKCQDNAALAALDVRASGDMRYLDLARCHVKDLDVTANTKLEHFDCSNNDKCDENQGNWISDLYFTSQALKTVVANNNDLYNITLPESLPSLTRMEFAHNHINGIDLSGATSLAREAIVDEDNGRTITAECTSSLKGGGNIYYFQLDGNAGSQGGAFLSLKPSFNDLKGDMRVSLANDNFDLANLNSWSSGVSGIVTGSRQALGAGSLQSDMVYGKIAVLIPSQESTSSASGQAKYTYDNGRSTSTFYLNWSSNGIVTAVDDLNADQQVENVTYYNLAGQPSSEMHDGVNIVVTTLKDGTTLTTKVMK